MKRSEMIKQIVSDHEEKYSENTVNEILFSLELYGMSPPSIINPNFQGGHNIQIHPYYIKEWESEDEKG